MYETPTVTVEFDLEGHTFTALNGGPVFKFNEAISFQVQCETQAEVDYYWEKLSEGGDEPERWTFRRYKPRDTAANQQNISVSAQ